MRFERLLLSDGKANKQKVLELSLKGNEIVKPRDIVKDPYVFEFLGIPENKPMMESDLEEALVRQIEKFLLESKKRFYVCWDTTKSDIWQCPLLCRYGVL